MYLSNISIAVAIKKKEELLWNKLKPSYVVIWQGHFTVLNPNIWRTLHKKVQTGILLLQRKTRSHAQLFWICESGLCFCGNRQQFELPDIRESRVAWTACTCKGEHVGIRTWEDWHFLMWKKSKHARSGILIGSKCYFQYSSQILYDIRKLSWSICGPFSLGIILLAIHDNIIHGLILFVTSARCLVLGCE